MNEVKISGVMCNNTKPLNGGAIFSLAFTTGKNQDGSYRSGFLNCRYFGNVDDLPEPRTKVTVSGWLMDNSYRKDGKNVYNLVVCTKDIKVTKTPEECGDVSYKSEKTGNSFDDSLPW